MPASSFDAFCRLAFTFLEEQGVRYLVIDGLAVVVVGEPRMTAHAGFELQLAVERERLATTGTMRFRRSQFQLDLITASLPFEEAAFRRASRHKIFGVRLPFPSPEDLILLKVLAGRDKDMLDAIGIARRHRDHFDTTYLETTIQPICDLAEDQSPWLRLQRVIADGR